MPTVDRRTELAAHLRQLRQERGLSVRQVAEQAGLSHAYVGSIEVGRQPASRNALDALAVVYGVDSLTRDGWYYLLGEIAPDLVGADIATARRALGPFRAALARDRE